MGFSLYNLLEASLLLINAVCILHEERFLAKIGWGRSNVMNNIHQGFGGPPPPPGVKGQLLNMMHSIRTVMRVPLIFVNTVVIIMKLIFG